jgi:hypothetical protein
VKAGRLYFGQWPLLPTSETSFFSPQDYGRVRVVLSESGEVERFDWVNVQGPWAWNRIGRQEDGES